jgi:hypothetical protein
VLFSDNYYTLQVLETCNPRHASPNNTLKANTVPACYLAQHIIDSSETHQTAHQRVNGQPDQNSLKRSHGVRETQRLLVVAQRSICAAIWDQRKGSACARNITNDR